MTDPFTDDLAGYLDRLIPKASDDIATLNHAGDLVEARIDAMRALYDRAEYMHQCETALKGLLLDVVPALRALTPPPLPAPTTAAMAERFGPQGVQYDDDDYDPLPAPELGTRMQAVVQSLLKTRAA